MGREINQRKAAIIGCGFVGSATAFTLMQSQLFSELVLVDVDFDKADGEAKDIAHGIPFAGQMKIHAGTYEDLSDAAIIIVTAGAGQKPGETRLDLVHKNVEIYESIRLRRNAFFILFISFNSVRNPLYPYLLYMVSEDRNDQKRMKPKTQKKGIM